MRRRGIVVSLIAAFLLVTPTWSQDPCQYAHVVDSCGKRVVILPTGDAAESHPINLAEGAAAAYEPRGVALATVPGWDQFHAFVIQGPYVHVVNYQYYHEDNDPPITPTRTIGLAENLNWTPIQLTGVAAGGPITVNGDTRYPLYVVGNSPGSIPHPHVMILDQEALIDGPLNVNKVVLAAGYLDHLDESGGKAIDIVVGGPLDDPHKQVAYASVLRGAGLLVQQFHTITIEDGVGFSIGLEPWNDEGLFFDGGEPDAIGMDYESQGEEAFGAFQTSSVEQGLRFNSQSCELGEGDMTDVAVWGPNQALDNDYMHFASLSNGTEAGDVLGYPEGVCPYVDPPQIRPGSLSTPTGPRPLALALSSRFANPFWLYAANGSGSVTAIKLLVYKHVENGDSVDHVGQLNLQLGGCPSAVVFRDPALEACMQQYAGDPPGPRPDDFCDENPWDPWCLKIPEKKPNID